MIEVKRNMRTGGYYCYFMIGEDEYYADLCITPDHGNECMIFKAEKGKVVDWEELYVRQGIPITIQSLVQCVEEFSKPNE